MCLYAESMVLDVCHFVFYILCYKECPVYIPSYTIFYMHVALFSSSWVVCPGGGIEALPCVDTQRRAPCSFVWLGVRRLAELLGVVSPPFCDPPLLPSHWPFIATSAASVGACAAACGQAGRRHFRFVVTHFQSGHIHKGLPSGSISQTTLSIREHTRRRFSSSHHHFVMSGKISWPYSAYFDPLIFSHVYVTSNIILLPFFFFSLALR